MRHLLLLFSLFCLVLPALAQKPADPPGAAYPPLTASDVRLVVTEANGATLLFNADPPVCDAPLAQITIAESVIAVDAYASLTNCDDADSAVALNLGELEPDTGYTLLLNDFNTLFFLPQPDEVIMDVQFPITWDEENDLVDFQRVDGRLDAITGERDGDSLMLTVSGFHPDGCETQTVTAALPDMADPALRHLHVFRLLPQGVMCPASIQDFEVTLTIPAADNLVLQTGAMLQAVNAEDGTLTAVQRQYMRVDTVIVTPADDQFRALVSGARNGDCGGELTTVQTVTDFGTIISIYEQAAADRDCTDNAPLYDDIVTVSALPVIVNGRAFDRDGALEDPDQSASRPDSGADGNFMQVDTVIESVEVAVLESFPMQVQVTVTGSQPDGCDLPVIVDEVREGDTVNVHIYRDVPLDVMCPAVLQPYEETFILENTFEAGPITLNINDQTVTINF